MRKQHLTEQREERAVKQARMMEEMVKKAQAFYLGKE